MHIAYLDPHPVPSPRTEALQILQTVDAMAALGAKVSLVTPSATVGPKQLLQRDVSNNLEFVHLDELHPWWLPARSNRLFYRSATQWLSRQQVDAVYCRNLKMADYLLASHGPPVFFETHEVFAQTFREDHPGPNWRERQKLAALEGRERRVYGGSVGLIALTQLLLDDIRQTYQVQTPGCIAADGADLILAEAGAKVGRHHPPILLYLGSLHPWKGVDLLIKALPNIPQGTLWIAGGGDARIAELQTLANELGVRDRVTLLGAVDPVKRFELIAQSSVCLLPLTQTSIGSRYTSPLKLFEYMAMGKPIVVADLPSIREVVQHEQHALLFAAEQPAALAAAVNRLMTDPVLGARLGLAAQAHSRNYSWHARAAHILKFMRGHLNHCILSNDAA